MHCPPKKYAGDDVTNNVVPAYPKRNAGPHFFPFLCVFFLTTCYWWLFRNVCGLKRWVVFFALLDCFSGVAWLCLFIGPLGFFFRFDVFCVCSSTYGSVRTVCTGVYSFYTLVNFLHNPCRNSNTYSRAYWVSTH